MKFTALLALIFFGAFTGTALAADAVAASDPSFSETAKAIFDAVMHSQWWVAASYGVILAMIAARKFMPAGWNTGVKGDVIGTAVVFVLALAGSVATVMAAPGAAMTTAVGLTALKVGVAAIGGYTIVHKIVGWLAGWSKMPAWATAILKMIAMMVGSNALAKASAAGAAAVAAQPPIGFAGNDKIVEVE